MDDLAPIISHSDGTTVIDLCVEPATPENIAPFGELVGGAAFPAIPSSAFYSEVRTYRPTFISDEQTEIAVCSLKRRPLRVRWMERHFKHTQLFLPLGAKPFVAVLAPPTDTDLPNIAEARAFLFDGYAGLSMHIGTWHEFPFALIDDTQLIVVLRKEATQGLLKENIVDGEGRSPDLDKKDITRRLGVVLRPNL
jgi:ureidoglycolate lyase